MVSAILLPLAFNDATHSLREMSSAPQPSQPHAALIWLIRGTGAFIACISVIIGGLVLASIAFAALRTHPWDFIGMLALLLLVLGIYGIRRARIVLAIIFAVSACYFFGCLVVAASRGQSPFPFSVNFGWLGAPLFVLGLLALSWFLGVVFGLFVRKGYDMWQRVDKSTVADFASVFALFAARVFHYVLPAHLPNAVNDHLWVTVRDPFSDRGSRMLWTWLALYLFYKLIKATLLRVLDLNDPNPPLPQNPPPSDRDAPFVPFDPYDLSKNRPLHPQ